MKATRFLIAPLLLLLASCGSLQSLSEGISDARELIGDLKETYETVKPEIETIKGLVGELGEMGEGLKGELGEAVEELKQVHEEAMQKADKDGDGELSWTELIAYIAAGGGGFVVVLRKYLQKLTAKVAAEAVADLRAVAKDPA